MPIYEYECLACGERTDELQRLSDPLLTTCRSCGGELKKLISAPAFQFKGSGWYVTDYARKSGGKGEGEGKGEGGDKAGGDSKSGGEGKGGEKAGAKSDSSSENSSEKKTAPAK